MKIVAAVPVRIACFSLLLSAFLCVNRPLHAQNSIAQSKPPIAIPFRLQQAGFVTLVIEDSRGQRVRNLLSETPFPKGNNTAFWDGLDDLGRDPETARRGTYLIPGKLVAPGKYFVRGLVRPRIEARYEMSVYSHGQPPWNTGDKSSEWLTNHTPPSAILWVPEMNAPLRGGKSIVGGQILAGSWVSEGGSGLAWMDTAGHKVWGQGWVGGAWTGVTQLARDEGQNPVAGVYAYAATAWDDELRLTELLPKSSGPQHDARMGTGEDRPLLAPTWKFPAGTPDLTDKGYGANRGIAGLAVRNGLLVASLPVTNQLLFVDARERRALGTVSVNDPRGLCFDAQNRLLVLSGTRLLRYTLAADPTQLATPEILIRTGLEDPQRVTLDNQSNIFISDWGHSHQVKLFSSSGNFKRAIGRAGRPQPGPYDANHMNHPVGVTIDGQGHLWVAENDFAPKRLSVWTREGKLVNAFYGPSQYGGGGELDSRDKNRFHYAGEGGGMTFALDWKAGTNRLLNVFSRSDTNPANLPQGAIGSTQPQTVFYRGARPYFTNVFTNNPTGGIPFGFLWTLEKNIATPRAGLGNAANWPTLAWSLPGYNKYFYVRWSGQIVPRHSQIYKFSTISDDGVRLWIGDKKLIDRWEEKGRSEDSGTITLQAGQRYDITMEFYQNNGGAMARLFWEGPHQEREIVPSSQLFSTRQARASGGLSAHYYAGSVYGDLRGTSHNVRRIDPMIDFDWNGSGPKVLQTPDASAFQARLPQNYRNGDSILFGWSDSNGDARVQPAEVSFAEAKSGVGAITVMPDLSFIASRLNGKAVRFAPVGFDNRGTPRYDLSRGQILAEGAQEPVSSGGDQVLQAPDGWTVLTNAPQPFSPFGVGGLHNGAAGVRRGAWSYPSLWHGLHASHDAPLPDRPGQLIGTTRLLGSLVSPRGSDAGPLWAINGNKGNVYLFTADGLFVATLFKDSRLASFNAPREEHNMLMNDFSLQEENFWPTISQSSDGKIYLTGGTSSIMRLDGLEGIRRLPQTPLMVSAAMLEDAQKYFVAQEAARQQGAKQGPLTVAMRAEAPILDGKLNEWRETDFVAIDQRASAAVSISGDRLYAAWKTDDPNLLANKPESLPNLFKTGGALDLMLGNVAGGQRLLVTRVEGQTTAVLYRPRDPQVGGEATKFISNLGINKTTIIDRVENVSAQVVLAQDGGNYELSVPLKVLLLAPPAGQSFKGDIGVLRGNGFQTLQRLYWNNKATGLTSDLATEAELTPQLWGDWEFHKP